MFGERAVAIMFKEYNQMEDKEVLSGVNTDSLTSEKNERHSGQSTL